MTEASVTSLRDVLQLHRTVSAVETVPDIVETSFSIVSSTPEETGEPRLKKSKTSSNDRCRSLEDRVESILSCCICLDLCQIAMLQCTNGHLMCVWCFHHLLADCKLKEQQAACPNCRCNISKIDCTRNLAVEKIILELEITCDYCSKTFLRHEIKRHQSQICSARPATCEYSLIGCDWTGPFHSLASHTVICEFPRRNGQQLLDTMRAKHQAYAAEKKSLETALSLLSMSEIEANDLVLKPHRTDDFAAKLYFESSRFTSLGYQWQVRVHINNHTSHPHTSNTRWFSYQLVLKSKQNETIDFAFLIVKDSLHEMSTLAIQPIMCHFAFDQSHIETEYCKLPVDSQECNRVLSLPSINFRLWMARCPSMPGLSGRTVPP